MIFLFIYVRNWLLIGSTRSTRAGWPKGVDVLRGVRPQHWVHSILPSTFSFFFISRLCLSLSSIPSSCLPFKVEEDCFSSIDPDSSLSDASFAAVSPLLGAGNWFLFFPLISLAGSDLCLSSSFFRSVLGGFVLFWSQVSFLVIALFFSRWLVWHWKIWSFYVVGAVLCLMRPFQFFVFWVKIFFFFSGFMSGEEDSCASIDKKIGVVLVMSMFVIASVCVKCKIFLMPSKIFKDSVHESSSDLELEIEGSRGDFVVWHELLLLLCGLISSPLWNINL